MSETGWGVLWGVLTGESAQVCARCWVTRHSGQFERDGSEDEEACIFCRHPERFPQGEPLPPLPVLSEHSDNVLAFMEQQLAERLRALGPGHPATVAKARELGRLRAGWRWPRGGKN